MPEEEYVQRHGGDAKDTVGRRCICNGLMTTAGFGDEGEPAIVTLGGKLGFLDELTSEEKTTYTAAEVTDYIFYAV